ncbi:MAG: tripartite tricarboxylate transporter permease [Halobacteriales archaeon]|nr:tripartite tricarboxylate transporter permease [Halobacteriales archaeon]
MEVAGVAVAVDPAAAGRVLLFALGGVAVGTLTGLVPGLHANNFALLLASIAPSIPGPPSLVGAAMLAAGVAHTFLDVVPAVSLGVPDAAMAASALPGHQLVIDGRGREAIRLSAMGSGLAALLALPLAWPVTEAMVRLFPLLEPNIATVLVAAAVFLVATEPTPRARLGGIVAFLASAGLGLLTLDVDPGAPLDAGGMLAPLFAGLFGAPVLVDAMGGEGVPPQADALVLLPRSLVGVTALAGTLAGAAVGYLPGISSAIAAVLVLSLVPSTAGPRGFLVTTSGVNTANTIFALYALVALGSPRTGVLVALDAAKVPLNLPLLLGAVAVAAAVSFPLVWVLGDRYLRVVGQVDYTRLSVTVLAGLAVVAYLFGGAVGVAAFVAAAVLGLLPPRFGAKRAHLMGVLMGPIILGA